MFEWHWIYLVFTPIVILVILGIVDVYSKSIWFCNVMEWHKAPKEQEFDGCSMNGICPRCGKKVMKDSQGNWF